MIPHANFYSFYTGLRPFLFNVVYNYERERGLQKVQIQRQR